MDNLPSWLAAVLNLDWNGVSPRSLPKTGEGLLLTMGIAKVQKGHNNCVARGAESLRCFCVATGEVSAHFCVFPGLESLCAVQWCTREVVKRGICDGRSRNFASLRFRGPWARAARR